MILVNNNGSERHAYWPLKHSDWNGWTPTDLVFPTFLFLVGVTIVLSTPSRIARGERSEFLFMHAFQRAAILFGLGILVHGFTDYPLATLRIYGVLQRIALCYLMATVLYLWDRRVVTLVGVAALACWDIGYSCVGCRFRDSACRGAIFHFSTKTPIGYPLSIDGCFLDDCWSTHVTPRADQHDSSDCNLPLRGIDGALASYRETDDGQGGRHAVGRNGGAGSGRSLGDVVSHQQTTVDKFLRGVRRRVDSSGFGHLLLRDRDQEA